MPSSKSDTPGSRRPSRRIWLVTAGIFALFVVSLMIAGGRKPPTVTQAATPPTNVELETIRPKPYREVIHLPARLLADKEVCVSSETGGNLDHWSAAEGALVHENDVIAQMEQETLLAQERRQQAAVAVAESQVELARIGIENAQKNKESAALNVDAERSAYTVADKEYRRRKELLSKGSIDRSAYDASEDERTQARVSLARAETALAQTDIAITESKASLNLAQETLASERAALAELQIQLAKTLIHAPVEGILDKHLVQPGELAPAGSRLACLYKNDVMRALVNVPDRQIAFLDKDNMALRHYVQLQAPGAVQEVKARIVIPGLPKLTGGFYEGLTMPAEVVRIAAAASEQSNTFQVELRIANPGRALRQGVLARAEIELLSFPEAMVIPLKAVQVSEMGPRVFVAVERDGKLTAEVRDIEPASISNGELLINSGLVPGDKLIVAGHRGLVQGETVHAIREDGKLLSEPASEAPKG